MQKILIICLLGLSFACAFKQFCDSSERQLSVCSAVYSPVCSIQKNNKKVTIGNRCMACYEEETLFLAEGSCEDYPEQAIFCHPNSHMLMIGCAEIYQPVCGVMQTNDNFVCDSLYCARSFENACSACQAREVSYYLPGGCDEQDFGNNIDY